MLKVEKLRGRLKKAPDDRITAAPKHIQIKKMQTFSLFFEFVNSKKASAWMPSLIMYSFLAKSIYNWGILVLYFAMIF